MVRTEIGEELENKAYELIQLPDEIPKEEYNTDQRRAWIYNHYVNQGNFKGINKKELSEEFGVSRQQFYDDIQIIRLWLRENPDKAMLEDSVAKLNTSVNKMMENGDYKDASDVIMKRLEFMQEVGAIEKQADKVEVDKNVDVQEVGFNSVNGLDDEGSDDGDE